MIRLLAFAFWLAVPAQAQVLPAFEGQWQGEGALLREGEPPQRFQCRLRLRATGAGESFLSGRCATAQAAQSFTYLLVESPDGSLQAEDRAAAENDLPDSLQGQAAPGLLRLTGGEAALIEMRREGDALRFTLAGAETRGEAVLHLRD